MSETRWPQLMKACFRVTLNEAEETAWFVFLRQNVKGWRHDPATEGRDFVRTEKAGRINEELCRTITRMANLEHVPRKQEKGRKDYSGQPTVQDLALWVWVCRQEDGNDGGCNVNRPFVEQYKRLVKCFADKGQAVKAAIIAGGNPDAAYDSVGGTGYADLNRLLSCNRAPTEQELALIRAYAREIGIKDIGSAHDGDGGGDAGDGLVDDLEEHFL